MVPLEMPGLPVDTGARPKGPVLAPVGQQLGALDHDSHRQGRPRRKPNFREEDSRGGQLNGPAVLTPTSQPQQDHNRALL